MWNFLKNALSKISIKRPSVSSFMVDDQGFSETNADGTQKTILWAELENVDILTTSEGPFLEDLFYCVRSQNAAICIGSLGAERFDLLKKFEKLPGFKWEAALQAMTSVQDAQFACWDKKWLSEQS